ncbi:ubiquitin domain-containing protein UBFD1 [Trichonephila clavipes]|nr:ubiquitin domain-containing protein UBFD1 [Trichonephila clavipes]
MRNNFWYFGDKPSFRIPFSKDVPLPVDDSPVKINSSSCPKNSIPSEIPLHSNTVDETETNDLHLREEGQALNKPVEKGGIIDIEAGKKKYLEISNAPTRGNTAENSVPNQVNNVDATPEIDSSTKPEGNASGMPNDRASGSKDMHIGSGNEHRNKDVRYDVEEHYTEGDLPQNKADSEGYFAEAHHDTSPVTHLSPRPRSYISYNERNERTNYYDSNRKYDWGKKGNFYHCSNSDTRGRRYGPNSYEKYNNKNQNYQGARRQTYDNEVTMHEFRMNLYNRASESISPSDKECFRNNRPECCDKDESKRQDICAGNSSNGAFFDRQRRNAYRSNTHFQDGRRECHNVC